MPKFRIFDINRQSIPLRFSGHQLMAIFFIWCTVYVDCRTATTDVCVTLLKGLGVPPYNWSKYKFRPHFITLISCCGHTEAQKKICVGGLWGGSNTWLRGLSRNATLLRYF